MNVFFRADANKTIGMGHIMRCLSIADAFHSLGHEVNFVVADDGISSLIKQRGYKVIVLNSDYKVMDDELECWPQDLHPDLIIVDSYYVTESYLKAIRFQMKNSGGKLVYIDDIYTFPYPVDILVDYNAYATETIYHDLFTGSKEPVMILGPTYVPLRTMFRDIPKREQAERVQNILISTGGSDELHLSLAILSYLVNQRQMVKEEQKYHFLLGAMNTDKETICTLAEGMDYIVLHENVSEMRSLIEGMDLAISAAGSTLYEICVCGVPLITFSMSDNQIPGAGAFENLDLAINVGDLRNFATVDSTTVMSGSLDSSAVEKIMIATRRLTEDFEKRCKMGSKMQELIDGFGADRTVQKILECVSV